MTDSIAAPDLTQRPPRSARCRLGGYVYLPRMLDKGRAEIAGKNGEFHYDCPLDQRIINFLGINAAALKAELATGKGDGEILEWINANAKNKHEPYQIEQWSDYNEKRGPDSDEHSGSHGQDCGCGTPHPPPEPKRPPPPQRRLPHPVDRVLPVLHALGQHRTHPLLKIGHSSAPSVYSALSRCSARMAWVRTVTGAQSRIRAIVPSSRSS